MSKSGPHLSENDINDLESQLGLRLPEDYRRFMLEHNGGWPEVDWCFDFAEPSTGTITDSVLMDIMVYYPGAATEPKYDDLVSCNKMLHNEGYIPQHYLQIATDSCGNLICLSTDEKDYGYMYFGDHGLEDTDTGYTAMGWITDSFTEFINGLYEFGDRYRTERSRSTDCYLANQGMGRDGCRPAEGFILHHNQGGNSLSMVKREAHELNTGGFPHPDDYPRQ